MSCDHFVTRGRVREEGSWCASCGEKVFDVEERECRDCIHSKELAGNERISGGWICRKLLMAIIPDMHVTYRIEKGSCFEDKPWKQL